jgi:hypothetical protein
MAEWTGTDYALLTAALAATHADIQSTKAFLRSGEGVEANPLLGENPSNAKLNAAGLLAATLGTGAAFAVPKEWRKPLLAGWAGMEATLAHQNKKVGAGQGERSFTDVMKKPVLAALAAGLLAHYGLPVEVGPTPDGKGVGAGIVRRF